jgi:hypothetical protein
MFDFFRFCAIVYKRLKLVNLFLNFHADNNQKYKIMLYLR